MSKLQKTEPLLKRYIWGTEEWFELFPDCPILIKQITAHEALSVQVHPDDAYARHYEGQSGKTELWYVTDAAKDAGIYYGLKRDLTKAELADRIQNGTLTEVLNFVKVKRGDTFMIEAGTIHAIGAGVSIAEIQQNSNLTYRLYDYGRIGRDGKPRELHIEKALDVAKLCAVSYDRQPTNKGERVIASCPYFTVTEVRMKSAGKLAQSENFCAVTIVDGSGVIIQDGLRLAYRTQDTFFVPGGSRPVEILPAAPTTFLLSRP